MVPVAHNLCVLCVDIRQNSDWTDEYTLGFANLFECFHRVKADAQKSALQKLSVLKAAGFISKPSHKINDKVNFNIGGAGVKAIPALNKLEEAALRKNLPASDKQAPPKKIVKTVKSVKTKEFGKKKEQRKILDKLSSAHIVANPNIRRSKKSGPKTEHKLRKSITPGTVLIILAGRFAGKRVVFLKQLPSGLLLVTGPFKLNGVPMRRVSPNYVIATSTKVDISDVSIPETVNDKYFVKQREVLPRGEKLFFKGGKPVLKAGEKAPKRPNELDAFEASEERKALQESVDGPIISSVQKVEYLGDYLKTRFTLSDKDKPHEMKF